MSIPMSISIASKIDNGKVFYFFTFNFLKGSLI